MIDSDNWGECKSCKWWQIEPEADVKDATMGWCIDEEMQSLLLLVSGNSGCDHYMQGSPARAAGSASRPPQAEPVR